MATLQLVVIAVVQGITEFLPVSSSAHLRLIPEFTGWPDQGLTIDIAVHVGTLLAVLVYFRRDALALAQGSFDLLRGRSSRSGQRWSPTSRWRPCRSSSPASSCSPAATRMAASRACASPTSSAGPCWSSGSSSTSPTAGA